jgi:hypothetical protein
MISTKCLLILLSIFSIFIIAPNSSLAEDAEVYPGQYDFGNVEVGSTETTLVRISNISGFKVDYLRVAFYGDTCGAFSVVTSPVPTSIPEGFTVEIEVAYSPSSIEQCSADFHIFTDSSPGASSIIAPFSGTGVESKSFSQNDDLIYAEQTVDSACPCNELLKPWKNHGAYVRCVAHAAEVLLLEEWITQEEKGAIVSARAKSDCGK